MRFWEARRPPVGYDAPSSGNRGGAHRDVLEIMIPSAPVVTNHLGAQWAHRPVPALKTYLSLSHSRKPFGSGKDGAYCRTNPDVSRSFSRIFLPGNYARDDLLGIRE